MSRTILILGASGMLGNAVYRLLSENPQFSVFGTVRLQSTISSFSPALREKIKTVSNLCNSDELINLVSQVNPSVVINCVGYVKQLGSSHDPATVLPLNSILPHRLAQICKLIDARVVHISTDCVFSGKLGMYTESDQPDALDLYGISKFYGEVSAAHVINLRTSIVGHELHTSNGLLEWFLKQTCSVSGYTDAIFSGLPTVELARVISDYVLPNQMLSGTYNVATSPITKFDFLRLVGKIYKKDIEIRPDKSVKINRSLYPEKFKMHTGYEADDWSSLIERMRLFG